MTTRILAIRLSRRAIASAALHEDAIAWQDGHHLTSKRDRACTAALRNVMRAVEQTQPQVVFVYAPTTSGGTTATVDHAIEQALADKQIGVQHVTTAELLTAFGRPPLRTSRELRTIIQELWTSLSEIPSRTQPYIVSAVAVALYAETVMGLRGVP
jgi:hypothetical protein